jgi:hypothetical protein
MAKAKAAKPIVIKVNLDTLTVHGWINKACKLGPFAHAALLAATRSFLMQGDHSAVTLPIMAKVTAGTLYPTPAVTALIHALVAWQAETSLRLAKERQARGVKLHNWIVTVWDGESNAVSVGGKVACEDSFADCNEACGWADRRLVDSAPSTGFAIIHAQTEKTVLRVTRDEAIERVYPHAKGPFCKRIGGRQNSLAMGRRAARDTRVVFSHG